MTAVPKKPEPKTLEISGEKLNIISKVRTFDGDIKSFKSRIKTIQERMQEVLDGTDEYSAVLEAQGKLDLTKENLKRRLDGISEWIKLTEDLAEERLSLKDANENMSDFLLAYFADTREKQIELGPKDAREVTIKARLGKAKDYQTNLFSAPAPEAAND
ncbi:MAG TPA: hypothetical protein VH234_06145 [Candidatus Saccharimonadales bacterium]|jgi:predicted  nucleic acid-binding Zn-ribbon protein|nr:hypothetical protein [Candidatus Saccharimonadales bacterium]